MPADRTEITEIVTGLAAFGAGDLEAALSDPPAAFGGVGAERWDRLRGLHKEGRHRAEFAAAWANGRAFLDARDGLRGRPPEVVEWKGPHRPPGVDPDSVSAGSFFTNPILSHEAWSQLPGAPAFPEPDGRIKTSAAWLIERAGFSKGYGRGAAGISSKHTLALINRGEATTAELLALAHEIADGVRARFGVELVPEPVLVGEAWGP